MVENNCLEVLAQIRTEYLEASVKFTISFQVRLLTIGNTSTWSSEKYGSEVFQPTPWKRRKFDPLCKINEYQMNEKICSRKRMGAIFNICMCICQCLKLKQSIKAKEAMRTVSFIWLKWPTSKISRHRSAFSIRNSLGLSRSIP